MEPAGDNVVNLRELRFEPANSNDAARAIFSHHFRDVPRCSFAKDDGISQYLGSETGMETFPCSPGEHVPLHQDVPTVASEIPQSSRKLAHRLLRSGFGLSVLLHAVMALAVSYVAVTLPDEDTLVEGVTVISVVIEGEADAAAVSAGQKEEAEEPIEKPVDKQPEPVKQPEVVKNVLPQAAEILKDLPMPQLGAAVPDILVARDTAVTKTEMVAKPVVEEKTVQQPEKDISATVPEPVKDEAKPKPVEPRKPEEAKTVEKKPDLKKQEPQKEKPKKDVKKQEKPVDKAKKKKGNQGDASVTARKGDVDARRKGETASDNSRGDSDNREIGNAARSNYAGVIRKKLMRAKSRIRNPGKGNVTVAFTITADGSVSGLRIAHSSGKEKIDSAALKIVSGAAPFPAIPAEAKRKSWPMSVPMQFK
ncbi:TonB family protein [Rhizobium sp. KVB221]|uniref:TonB family protein n=1 Tax=Rhizobium setariae TaxID=2801340 RepID=A0A937CM52_9HYPH|nr:TonB family protein [Rhizobium setariae]MBL0370539.1 TonB family protein [Rhizobium setariae]